MSTNLSDAEGNNHAIIGKVYKSNIVAFPPKKEACSIGGAFCIGCKHVWIATAPIGTTELECPNCHSMKGRFKFVHAPSAEQKVRECSCGNQLFYLTPEGHMCANCGAYQSY